MALTNRLNLPHSIVQAVTNDPYKGGGDISVTQLILPPYLRLLRKKHPPQEDVADRIWALMGQIGHSVLERYTPVNALKEERLFTKVKGPVETWEVSGQFDLLEEGILTDFKYTSIWAGMNGGKVEWEQQLNLLRLLCDEKYENTYDGRYEVDKLQIIAIYRDWQKSKVGDEGYPKSQIDVIPIDLWDKQKASAYLHERVSLHQNADPEPCTDMERWKRPDVFAVQKTGGKRALKLFPIKADADNWLAQQSDKDKMWVGSRLGEYVRCSSYCSVSHACPVWQAKVKSTIF